MGIFSWFNKNQSFKLKKTDFKTKKEEYKIKITSVNEEFAISIAEFKKQNDIPERKNETDKITSVTNYTDVTIFSNTVRVQYDPTELQIQENIFISELNEKLNWITENETTINSAITKKLLPLKNENWIEENEKKISEKEFIKRIKLTSILIFDDTSLELEYDDGDIFYAHQIIVDLNKENEITNVDIHG